MRAALLGASATLLLSACSGRHSVTHADPTPHATSSPSACNTADSGFGLSVVTGTAGSASPLAAAKDFVRQGGVPGYGSPASQWHVGTPGPDGKVTLSDGHTELQAVQLPDKTWVIAGGDKCG